MKKRTTLTDHPNGLQIQLVFDSHIFHYCSLNHVQKMYNKSIHLRFQIIYLHLIANTYDYLFR